MNDVSKVKFERRGLLFSAGGSLLVGCNGLLFYFLTSSEAILLDGLYNLTFFLAGLFSLKVASLVLRGDDERFPLGYIFFEPLINGIKGLLILGLSLMALVSALKALFSGGREIALDLAVVYGLLATIVCWTVAWLVRRAAARSQSPLVITDAASWLINALISTGVLVTFLIIFLIRNTELRTLVPYVDPALVILVSTVTIGVPVRLARKSLLELLNRTPSAELLERVRSIIRDELSELPVVQLVVRVIQPGRTRLISAHVVLPRDHPCEFQRLDEVREKVDAAIRADYDLSIVDVIFTGDPRWGAPLNSGGTSSR